jgi:hypothetical protein
MFSICGTAFYHERSRSPDLRQWEINLPWTLKRTPGGQLSGELVRIDVNYGYDPYTQLSIELPFPYTDLAKGGLGFGAGDVLLEYKRRLDEPEEASYFGTDLVITLPTGDERRGLGAGRVTLELPLLYQRRWDEAVVYSDFRYKWQAGDQGKSFWFFGAAVERLVNEQLKIGAEIYGTTPTAFGGEGNAGFNLGGKYKLAAGTVLMFSAGRSFRAEPELTLLLGLKILIPP